MHDLKLKRSYEPESEEDGARILVDRLWPRGESKVKADLTEWDKSIAPESGLRRAFHEGELSFEEFKKKYLAQLDASDDARIFASHVKDLLEKGNVTLLFASKDEAHNNAVVLKEWLDQKPGLDRS